MKKKEFASLARQLLPHFSGMVVHIPLMLLRPVKPVLRGICFEGSGSDPKTFYVWKFWLPLYVPRKRISFTHGERLRDKGGAEMWNVTESRLVERLTDAELRARTEAAVARAFALIAAGQMPPPLEQRAKCRDCSLEGICLPREVRMLRNE